MLLGYTASKKLAERYYFITKSGGNNIFCDSEEDHRNWIAEYLHSSLSALCVSEYDSRTFGAVCKGIIDNTYFKPIILSDVYRPYQAKVI